MSLRRLEFGRSDNCKLYLDNITCDFRRDEHSKILRMFNKDVDSFKFILTKFSRCGRNGVHKYCQVIRSFLLQCGPDCCVHFQGFENLSLQCCLDLCSVASFPTSVTISDDNASRAALKKKDFDHFLRFVLQKVSDGYITDLALHFNSQLDKKSLQKLKTSFSHKQCALTSLQIEVHFRALVSDDLSMSMLTWKLPQCLKTLKVKDFTDLNVDWANIVLTCLASSDVFLKCLKLEHVHLVASTLEKLTNYVSHARCKLKELAINVDLRIPCDDFSNFADALSKNNTIQTLTLRHVCKTVFDATIWQNCFINNNCLRVVRFNYNYTRSHKDYYVNILQQNTRLEKFYVDYSLTDEQRASLFASFNNIYNIIGLFESNNEREFQHILDRNRSIQWREELHKTIVDYCLAMAPFDLPAYILLWIFEWLPLMHLVQHQKLIHLIQGVVNSVRDLKDRLSSTKQSKRSRNKK